MTKLSTRCRKKVVPAKVRPKLDLQLVGNRMRTRHDPGIDLHLAHRHSVQKIETSNGIPRRREVESVRIDRLANEFHPLRANQCATNEPLLAQTADLRERSLVQFCESMRGDKCRTNGVMLIAVGI